MGRGLALLVGVIMGVMVGGAYGIQEYYGDYAHYNPPSVIVPPTYYDTTSILSPFAYSGSPVRVLGVARDTTLLPCTAPGFFVHPTNSSRFYRCVDHTGTGRFFVRYLFECSKGFVFDEGVSTCLPGYSQPGSGTTAPPTEPKPTPTKPTEMPTKPTVTPTVPTVAPTDPPVTQTQPPSPPTDPPVKPIDPPVQMDCVGQYIQHETYCNVYRQCNDTKSRYMCPGGTAFDEQRQMCRIHAADEKPCEGKSVAAFPYFLRTVLVKGHMLLPDHYVLRPVPVSHLEILPPIHPGPNYALRTETAPARQPPSHFPLRSNPVVHPLPLPPLGIPQTISQLRPRPLTSPYAYSYDTHHSVNNVRRPQNHLHFPHYFGNYYVDFGQPNAGF